MVTGWFPMSNERSEVKMRNYPKVSVIIPSFNGLELLKMSIPALLRTHYPNLEIIAVDNGSSDNSAALISKLYPGVLAICIAPNIGITNAYSVGISASHGSLLSFLNNDMEVHPDWLLPLVLAIEDNECLAACDSKYLQYYERDKFEHTGGAGRFSDKYGNTVSRGSGEIDKGQFNIQQEVFYSLALFRKDLILKVGGFDKSFFGYYEETDLCWRLHRLGYKMLYVPESVIYHMGSATTFRKVSEKEPNKRIKKKMAFHFFKNRLRMIIKNQFGMSLIFSVLVCLFDFCGTFIVWLLSGKSEYVSILGKALIWNLKNFKGTLQNRIRYTNESTDFNELFLPYSGVWKTKASIV